MESIKSILEKKTGLYSGLVDGEEAILGRQEGKGFSITVPTHDGWYETTIYNEQGELEETLYEK
jgi:hypothetical protein